MKKHAIVIGAGFAGLASAALLAKKGLKVTLLEKNDSLGGRAMSFSEEGFTFDMGPSWYMMPEVFDRFFGYFGKKTSDYYSLTKLDPKYRIVFGKDEVVDMRADNEENYAYFERIEPGSSARIRAYLEKSSEMYSLAMQYFVYKNYDSIFDMIDLKYARAGLKLPFLDTMDSYISRFVKSEKLKKILLYTTVFIGGVPKNTPAIYTLMSHLDFNDGVYYPQGGIAAVVAGLVSLCQELNVTIRTNSSVDQILVDQGIVQGVQVGTERIEADYVISNADYAHTEMQLLEPQYQTFTASYWHKKTIAPSAFVLYLGVKGSIPQLAHHTLFFTHDWEEHFEKMYSNPSWPDKPSMYICNPSKTDSTVAPDGSENLFILVPIAPGLEDTPEIRTTYRNKIIAMIDDTMKTDIAKRIQFERILTMNDYKTMYNAYQGTALGLAPTLLQTAFFRPPNHSKKVRNLFFAGQNTLPGVGVPMGLISAELAVSRIVL